MGTIFSVTCENKKCKYNTILCEGTSMLKFAELLEFQDAVISDAGSNSSIAQKLKNGAKIMTNGIYLCPECKEFKINNTYYLMDNITVSPYGTLRYDISFPFNIPACDICNSELVYVKNILSSKVKCPKCGNKLKARKIGCAD